MGLIVGMLVPLVLSATIARCAPRVGPVTMSAIVMHESGAKANAIGDNTLRRSFFPTDRRSAVVLARSLLRLGHNIDVGYAQVNSANLTAYGLDVVRAFEPCANVQAGSSILRRAYRAASLRFGPGQLALAHALSAYNSGGYYAGLPYARDVYALAKLLRYRCRPHSLGTDRCRLAFRPAGRARAR